MRNHFVTDQIGLRAFDAIRCTAASMRMLVCAPEAPERIRFSDVAEPRVGDKFEFVVGYTDTTTMLHDELCAARDDKVEVVWPILGRGKLR